MTPSPREVVSDLFHEDVPDDFLKAVFRTMIVAAQHSFQILTKRPERMRDYLKRQVFSIAGQPPRNIWLGVSCEDQKTADLRIPVLLDTPAEQRFVSCEPLIGPIDLQHLQPGDPPTEINALDGTHGVLRPHRGRCSSVDWVIIGGESGSDARPCDVAWIRDLVRQCREAEVPAFVKQLGARK